LRPREKSFGAAGGTAEVGEVARPLAGLFKPGLRGGIDDVLVGIPVEGIPVDGNFSPLVGPLMGIDGLDVEVVGIGPAGGVPVGRKRSIGSGFLQFAAWS
jgi:hypothetical protein